MSLHLLTIFALGELVLNRAAKKRQFSAGWLKSNRIIYFICNANGAHGSASSSLCPETLRLL